MVTEATFQMLLIAAALLCSLVAGFLFAFATVIMPGLKMLNDREFIRAFQVIDGVIQNNQPLFVAVWTGSIVTLVASVGLGWSQLDGVQRLLLILAALVYVFGVQVSTFAVNVPLNNQLQRLDVDITDKVALRAARTTFEPRWNRWNRVRTPLASLTLALIVVLLFQM